MRRALFLAATCFVCLSQAGLASPLVIKLSRANTSYPAFLTDRDACLKGAGQTGWSGRGTYAMTWTRYDVRAFASCMNAKGYMLDPNGYRAIQYQYDSAGREYVYPL